MRTQNAMRCLVLFSTLVFLSVPSLAATPETVLETEISLLVADEPLAGVMKAIANYYDLKIELAADVNKALLLNFQGEAKLKNALQKMLEPFDLTYEIETDGIVIMKNILNVATEVSFVETPLEDVVQFISDQHGVKTSIADGVDKNLPITLVMERGTLKGVLKKMLEPHGLSYKFQKYTLVIVKAEKKAR